MIDEEGQMREIDDPLHVRRAGKELRAKGRRGELQQKNFATEGAAAICSEDILSYVYIHTRKVDEQYHYPMSPRLARTRRTFALAMIRRPFGCGS